VQAASSNHKGSVAELAIATAAAKQGIQVLMPMTEHGRYDLAFEIGAQIMRIQCKWARQRDDVVIVNLATSRHTPLNGYRRSTYSAAEVDAVIAYCGDLDRCYFFPIAEIEGRSSIFLRLSPAKNGQRAAINFAKDYEFDGAVAQLARATGWQPVGRRFESDQLHDNFGTEEVGAERFGKHPARFLQRAAAGEEFLISRRGRPMARLSPVDNDTPPG
jgi:PD-(D/E)XK nuclease superfamily protein